MRVTGDLLFDDLRHFTTRTIRSFVRAKKIDPVLSQDDLEQEAYLVWLKIVRRYDAAAVIRYSPLYVRYDGIAKTRRAICVSCYKQALCRWLIDLSRQYLRRQEKLPQVSRLPWMSKKRGLHLVGECASDLVDVTERQPNGIDSPVTGKGYDPRDFLRYFAQQYGSEAFRGLLDRLDNPRVPIGNRKSSSGRETTDQWLARLCGPSYEDGTADQVLQEVRDYLQELQDV